MKKTNAKRAVLRLLSLLVLLAALPLTATAAEHTHSWTYSQDNLNTVTATCTDTTCTVSPVTLTLGDSDATYTGTAKEIVIRGLQENMPYTVSYFDLGTGSKLPAGEPPLGVGRYRAQVNFGAYVLTQDYEISTAVIDTVDLNALVTAPVAGQTPSTDLIAPAGCTATLLWTPTATQYDYNAAYTATVTLEIADNGYRFANTVNGGQGWVSRVEGNARVFTKTYSTEKVIIQSYTAPLIPDAFEYRYESFDAILTSAYKELPSAVTAMTEIGEKQIPLIWSCTNYNVGDQAENLLTWALDLSNYRITDDSLAKTGSKTVTNAAAPIELEWGGGSLYLHYGQTWGEIDATVVSMYEKDTDNKAAVPGTWEILDYSTTERPQTSGEYRARFTPTDAKKYKAWEGEITLAFWDFKPDVDIRFSESRYYPTQTVQVRVSARNHYHSDWFLSADLLEVRYTIDGTDQGILTAVPTEQDGVYLYSFTLPVAAEGKRVEVKVTTARVPSQYLSSPGSSSFVVQDRIPVINSAVNSTVDIPYVPTYDIQTLFRIGTGAGNIHYELYEGSSFARLDGSVLTIDKAGTVKLRLTTDANGIYAAGAPVEVTLIISRATGSGSLTVNPTWVYGQTITPEPSTTTNDVDRVTYYYQGANGTVYSLSTTPPTNVGSYTVYAVFGETDKYLQYTTDTAAFTITAARPTIGNVSYVGTVYDTTAVSAVNGMLRAPENTIPGTLRLVSGTVLDSRVTEYTYEFIPDSANYTTVQGTVVLRVIRDEAERLLVSGTLNTLDYIHGDRLLLDGVTLEAEYTSGATRPLDISDAEIVLPTLTAGDTTATIQYRGVSYTFTIREVARKTISITGVSAATGLVYNGQAQAGFTGTPSSEYTGVYVFTYVGTLKNGTAYAATTEAPRDAGSYTVTVSVPAENPYYIGSTTVDFVIEKAEIDVSGLRFPTSRYTYNGEVQGPGTLTGSIPAGVSVGYTGTTATNAGNYTATAVLSLAPNYPENNYTIVGAVTVTLDWSIAPATVTITPKNTVGYVAFERPTFTYHVTGLFGRDALLTAPTLATVADMTTTGTFPITASGADAGANYTIQYGTGTLTVLRASASGEIAIEGWTYGQPANAPTHQDVLHDATPVYYYTGEANDGTTYSDTVPPVKAGTYSVYAVFGETARYEEYTTVTVDFVIRRATPTYRVPTGLTARFGDRLSSVTLPTGMSWQSPASTAVGDAGSRSFFVTYVPEDTDNYNTVTGISVTVTVEKLDISQVHVSLGWKMTYNGMQQTRSITVTEINGQQVTYSIFGNKATDAGTYELTIVGMGNFTGSKTVLWTLEPLDISDAQVTLADALIYNGEPQTQQILSVLIKGLEVTYTQSGEKTATDVDVYYMTLQGTGNFTGECRVKWTIAPNTEKIEGLTPDNVTTDHKSDIEDVLNQIQSDTAKQEWAGVVDKCEKLLAAIEKARGSIEDLLKRIDAYDIESVKSVDKNGLLQLEKEVERVLSEGALTDEQKEQLVAAENKLDALLSRIDEVAKQMADIHDRLDGYTVDTVTSDDRADIAAILRDINALLDGNNLSVSERLDMEDAKRRAELLLTRIDEVAAAIDTITETLGGISSDHVPAEDRDLLKDTLEDINALLQGTNLTDKERETMEAAKKKAEELLTKIDAAANNAATLLDRLAKYDIETVKSTDQADIEDILADIRELLDSDSTGPADTDALKAGETKAEALLERIRVAADAAKTRIDGLNKDNVTRNDRSLLEGARADLEKALQHYAGNYTESERADIDAKLKKIAELLALLDQLDAVQDLIDRLPNTADPSDTDIKDAYEEAKDAYDRLTDAEKEKIDAGKLDHLGALLGAYAIVEGADCTWKNNSKDGLQFVANGAADRLTEILIDGKAVDAAGYTVSSPSTTLTLKAELLATLEEGEHRLTVRYADGEASCNFTVEAVGALAWLWVMVAIIVAVGGGTVICFFIYKKKEEQDTGVSSV